MKKNKKKQIKTKQNKKPSLELKCQKFKPFRDVFEDQKLSNLPWAGPCIHLLIKTVNQPNDRNSISVFTQAGWRWRATDFCMQLASLSVIEDKHDKYKDHFFFIFLPYIVNPLLTKLDRSRWLDIALVLFCVYVPRLRLGL